MAQFNLNVPNENIAKQYGDFNKEYSDSLNKKIASIKNLYGSIIDEVSKN